MGAASRSEVLVMTAGAVTATVHPGDGGRIGQVNVDGRRLLRGPDEGAAQGWPYWGCYPLLPWSNRIPAGRFEHGGRVHEVPVNWSDGTALHGLTAWRPWNVTRASDAVVEEEIETEEGPYWVRGLQRIRLTPTHLDLGLEVRNMGAGEVPVGLGIHPWFRSGAVRVPADLVWPGAGPLPDGPPRPVTSEEDLRRLRVPPPMDRCYTGLTAATAEVPGVDLEWSGPVGHMVVYSEDPEWVCVEPVTMANDGFRLAAEGIDGHGVVTLAPQQSLAVEYRFTWTAGLA